MKSKEDREDKVNNSKFRQQSLVSVGDTVLMRNHNKRSKFQPTFLPEPFKVINVSQSGRILVIERSSNGKVFRRHPDDIKIFNGEFTKKDDHQRTEKDEIQTWHDSISQFQGEKEECTENETEEVTHSPALPRRSERVQRRNERYYNEDFENN